MVQFLLRWYPKTSVFKPCHFAYTVADRLYWLDDNYVQPFYSWAAPRLRDVAISGIFWALVTLIDVSLWLIDTTSQFMTRDARAITLDAFAQSHEPLPELLALCPAVVPMTFSQFLDPDHSVRSWLTAALPLTIAPFFAEAKAVPVNLTILPVVAEAAPVVQKSRKSKATDTMTEKTLTDKTPRRRSQKKAPTAAAQ